MPTLYLRDQIFGVRGAVFKADLQLRGLVDFVDSNKWQSLKQSPFVSNIS